MKSGRRSAIEIPLVFKESSTPLATTLGVPVEFALLSILAAFGVAFGVLFRALTLITGRRRRRSLQDGDGWGQWLPEGDGGSDGLEAGSGDEASGAVVMFQDFLWLGRVFYQ